MFERVRLKPTAVTPPGSVFNRPSRPWAVVQPKLEVGAADDEYEREADRVADEVMRMQEPAEHSAVSYLQSAIGGQRSVVSRQPSASSSGSSSPIAHHSSPPAGIAVPPEVEARIQGLRGGGRPLSEPERAFFEPRFGFDFSKVRIHDDSESAAAARAVNARAFTVGQDIVLGRGRFSMESEPGLRLLAHELVHDVQQHRGLVGHHAQRQQAQEDAPGRVRRALDWLAGVHVAAAALAEVGHLSHYLYGAHGFVGTENPARGRGNASSNYCHTYPNRGNCTEHKHFDCVGLVVQVFNNMGWLWRVCDREPWTVKVIEDYWCSRHDSRVHKEKDWEGRSAGDLVIFHHGRHIGIYAGFDHVISARGDECDKTQGCGGKGVSIDPLSDFGSRFFAYLDIDWGDEPAERSRR